MKWALVMYFFYFGPWGGWGETDRRYYPDQQSCIEAQKIFEEEILQFEHVLARVKIRCEEIKD